MPQLGQQCLCDPLEVAGQPGGAKTHPVGPGALGSGHLIRELPRSSGDATLPVDLEVDDDPQRFETAFLAWDGSGSGMDRADALER